MISYKIMFRKWFNTRSEIIYSNENWFNCILYCWEKNAGFSSKAYFIRKWLIFLKKLLHKIHLFLSFLSIYCNHFFYYKRARIEMIICDLFFMMPVIYLFVLFLINDMFPWFYIPAMVLFSIFVWCLEWLIWVS